MTVLAIDTSGLTAGAAVINENKTLAEFSVSCKLTHSETLMPMIDQMLKTSGTELSDIDCFAVSSGPGSFTGLRIGAACAMGLAFGLSKSVIEVPTLDALAYNVYKTSAVIVPVMDARRGQVYAALYRFDGVRLERISDYLAEDMDRIIEIAAEAASKHGGEAVFLGDGVPPHADAISCHKNFYTAAPHLNLQRAASVGALALIRAGDGKLTDPSRLSLFYIRKPQAEREYEAKERT